jgi:glutaredoxin-related protein
MNKKLTIIGSHLCQDTLYALMKIKDLGTEVEFLDISASFPALKRFLEIREKCSIYDTVKECGGIGIPLFILEDDTKVLGLEAVLAELREN